jgi:molybdopterin-containing oxidoreductase family iron-sulfur binding subunit
MTVAEQKQALVKIYNVISGSAIGTSKIANEEAVMKAAQQLKQAGSNGVLVCGIQDKNAQLLVLAINQALNSAAFSTVGTRQIRKGSNEKMATILSRYESRKCTHTYHEWCQPCLHLTKREKISPTV